MREQRLQKIDIVYLNCFSNYKILWMVILSEKSLKLFKLYARAKVKKFENLRKI